MVQLTNNDLINQKIQELVRLKLKDNKKDWKPGIDWVQYSGSYFTEDEYVATISTLLDGWLALGEDGIRFENKFSPKLGKQYGICVSARLDIFPVPELLVVNKGLLVIVFTGTAKKDPALMGSGFIFKYRPAGELVFIILAALSSNSRTLNFLFE